MKKKNKLHGLTLSNDEGIHYEFANLLYNNHIENKLTFEIAK
jgi:hypothetical protein